MDQELMMILTRHAGRYPQMEPRDAVKLIYQNEFGGGHMIADPEQSLRCLLAEHSVTPRRENVALAEDIGNGMVRVNLAAVGEENYPLEELNGDFVRSAALHRGSMDSFLGKLELLRALTGRGVFAFSPRELEEYLAPYIASGCPPVSHSQTYRDAYGPAYRVVCRDVSFRLLVSEIRGLRKVGKPVLVALDGRCASGKTTLARRLGECCGWSVAHMDHFFLRPEQRTAQRYAAPGENIDHERFLAEVLGPLSRGEQPLYRPFRCGDMTVGEPIDFPVTDVVIVEGSYSCHPALWECYDLHVFVTLDREKQMQRIIDRDGADYARVFRDKWIPLEERYFSAFRVEERCERRFWG